MAKRIQVRVSDPIYDRVFMWADRLGVSVSQLSGMAIQAGLDSIIRAVSPVDSVTPEQWAKIAQAMEIRRVDENDKK